MQNTLDEQPIAWSPTPEVIERARLTQFMKQVGASTWEQLYQYSINDVEMFTAEVLRFLDIDFEPPYDKLLDTSGGIEFPKWFTSESLAIAGRQFDSQSSTNWPPAHAGGSDNSTAPTSAGLNITTMCLDRWQNDDTKDQPAVIWEGEDGSTETLTYAELMSQVNDCAEKLCDLDIRKGDAVGIHLPMLAETVVALLAINRIGAIAVPVFSGYGIDAIASRMEAVGAKVIFTCYGTRRRGKFVDMLTVAGRAVAKVGSIESVIVIDRGGEPAVPVSSDHVEAREQRRDDVRKFEYLRNDVFGGRRVALWGLDRETISSCDTAAAEKSSAEDPLIILYTSGTTGKPKGIAHTHASFPIKAAQDMAFGTDVGKGTRISWYTDIGWMMGPWLIYGALINGATICIYDGAPDYPTTDRMWEFCAKHKVEVLGISPTLIRSLAAHETASDETGTTSGLTVRKGGLPPHGSSSKEAGVNPPSQLSEAGLTRHNDAPYRRHDLSSLRAFASTGEPWNPAPWWWLFKNVGNSKLPIINYSGGTEISGGILMGNPLLPIKPCSFPAPCPGMDVDILDENGNAVPPGTVGELVIKQPWVGMARGFWQENDRYLDTYWRRFPGIWVHGDFALRDKDGHWFILGRSDDTLKVAGKRVGPAEVESILVSHPQVTEAAVIGVPDEAKGTAMVAFCVLTGTQASRLRTGAADFAPRDDGETEQQSGVASETLALQSALKALVARDMGKPLAPSKIHFVTALPKTRNAKVMRRVIRSAYLGEDAGDVSALEDPAAVDEVRKVGKIE